MSMTISIRRGKGRSLDAYCTAHWLGSINNKTTQWGARLLVHRRAITNQLYFPSVCVRVKYLSRTPCRAPIKDVVMLCVCLSRCKLLTSRRRWEYSDADLPSYSLYPSPSIYPPPLPFHHLPHLSACSVVAVSPCIGEACMCILTRAALRFPSEPTPRACCLHSVFFVFL